MTETADQFEDRDLDEDIEHPPTGQGVTEDVTPPRTAESVEGYESAR